MDCFYQNYYANKSIMIRISVVDNSTKHQNAKHKTKKKIDSKRNGNWLLDSCLRNEMPLRKLDYRCYRQAIYCLDWSTALLNHARSKTHSPIKMRVKHCDQMKLQTLNSNAYNLFFSFSLYCSVIKCKTLTRLLWYLFKMQDVFHINRRM